MKQGIFEIKRGLNDLAREGGMTKSERILAKAAERPFDFRFKSYRIPFVALWSEEAPAIQRDQHVGRDAVYSGRTDHRKQAEAGELGKPILGQMSPNRQRFCVINDICQVCGRFLIVKMAMGHYAEHGPDHDKVIAIDEPMCCPECALEAMSMCPYVEKEFVNRGCLVVGQTRTLIQLATMEKGDDRGKLFHGATLDRATFRRWMGKPLAVHARIQPLEAIQITKREQVEAFAEEDRRKRAEFDFEQDKEKGWQ